MATNRQVDEENGVDRRVENFATQQPGYTSTEQVTRDVASERRQQLFQVDWIVWTVLGVLEILLGLRFFLKLIAANPASGFAVFMYGITRVFVAPFTSLIGTPSFGGSTLEVTTLIAMAIYALVFWLILRVIHIAFYKPAARTVTRSTTRDDSPPTQ